MNVPFREVDKKDEESGEPAAKKAKPHPHEKITVKKVSDVL